MLLSADAANIALEKLHAEDFYRPAHQQVFEAIQGLFDANEPIDAVTVSEVLRRDGSLERMGGVDFLTGLLDMVPTTSNIEYYADIVEEHALRRRLMRVGGTIGSIATEMQEPIADVLDRSEQEVFLVSERRVGTGLAPIDPLLGQPVAVRRQHGDHAMPANLGDDFPDSGVEQRFATCTGNHPCLEPREVLDSRGQRVERDQLGRVVVLAAVGAAQIAAARDYQMCQQGMVLRSDGMPDEPGYFERDDHGPPHAPDAPAHVQARREPGLLGRGPASARRPEIVRLIGSSAIALSGFRR